MSIIQHFSDKPGESRYTPELAKELESSLTAAKAEIARLTKDWGFLNDYWTKAYKEKASEIGELKGLLKEMLGVVKQVPSLQGREYVGLGIRVNRAISEQALSQGEAVNAKPSDQEAHDREVRREALNEAAKAVYRHIEWMPVEPEIEDFVIARNEVIKECVAAIEALRSEPSKGQGGIPK